MNPERNLGKRNRTLSTPFKAVAAALAIFATPAVDATAAPKKNEASISNKTKSNKTKEDKEKEKLFSTQLERLEKFADFRSEIIKDSYPRAIFTQEKSGELVGYEDLCKRVIKLIGICNKMEIPKSGSMYKVFNIENFELLNSINYQVNNNIEPRLDSELHKTSEFWEDEICPAKGDCEQFVICKYYKLLRLGFPRESMKFAFVKDNKGQGHIILLVDLIDVDLANPLNNKIFTVRLDSISSKKQEILPLTDITYSGIPLSAINPETLINQKLKIEVNNPKPSLESLK